jgi:methylthioribose-1-phosphate isomerase
MEFDRGLPFLIQADNVARYDQGHVIILDRRKYPQKIEFVDCPSYREVAQAISDMVTQSLGPWLASAYGMVSAAREVKNMNDAAAKAALSHAAETIANARPTTSGFQKRHIQRILDVSLAALERGEDVEGETLAYVQDICARRYEADRLTGRYAASLLPGGARILTQCFAETLIGYTLLEAQQSGKDVSIFCPETRPYLQGARLTASVAVDMGITTTVITDNMPAFLMAQGKVDAFVCAADVITLDGYVVNKVGTFQIALAAHYHKIPFYALRDPSVHNPSIASVEIEERNPAETLSAFGQRTAKEGVRGWYPAFDITPPHLVGAVVTSRGIFSPWDLKNSWGK